jgi:arsenate reductase
MTIIWHNPRCSKSRQTLALLEEHGEAPTVVKYLETPPTAAEIRTTLATLNIPAIKLMRTGEKTFKDLGLSKTDDDETLITAMAQNPILIERPVVLKNHRAATGRPPESVLKILGD